MSETPIAVYCDVVDLDPTPGVELLSAAGFDVRVLGTADPDEIAARAPDANVLLVGYGRVDGQLLDRLPRVRLVCTQSAGVDNVDLDAARARRIWVANVAAAATEEVAAHALAMALSLTRCLPQLDRDVRAGRWDGTRFSLRNPRALTLGVIGMGRIGTTLAGWASGMFGSVLGYDPAPARTAWPSTVRRLDLRDVVRTSDVLSLHLPLTRATRHLIGPDELATMPEGAVLVNVSRGELVDLDALVTCLDAGHLGGAALDVLPEEPPPVDHPALRHPRVLVTPHAAYLSPDSTAAYVREQAANAMAWHRDGRPLHVVIEG